jgi:hypothetical protein
MSKTLEDILLNSVTEMYDGNTVSQDYSQSYMQKLMKARAIDAFSGVPEDEVSNDTIEPEELYAHLVRFVQDQDDEVTITYDDGQSVTFDVDVAKQLITYASTEDIEEAGENIDFLHALIYKIYDEVISPEDNE